MCSWFEPTKHSFPKCHGIRSLKRHIRFIIRFWMTLLISRRKRRWNLNLFFISYQRLRLRIRIFVLFYWRNCLRRPISFYRPTFSLQKCIEYNLICHSRMWVSPNYSKQFPQLLRNLQIKIHIFEQMLIRINNHLLSKLHQINPLLIDLIQKFKKISFISLFQSLKKISHNSLSRYSEEFGNIIFINFSENTHLINILYRISHMSLRNICYNLQCWTSCFQAFFTTNLLQMCNHRILSNLSIIKYLTTRNNRIWNLVKLRCRQNKTYITLRLFNRLK